MKRKLLRALLPGAVVTLAASAALAGYAWTNYVAVDQLDATPDGGYRVWARGLPSMACPNSDYVMPYPNTSEWAQKQMNTMLSAAMMAGKQVKLRIEMGVCRDDRPTYREVRVSKNQ